MSTWTLLASAILAIGTAAGFAAIGMLLSRRPYPAYGRKAGVMFSLFWWSAAIIWLTQGLHAVAALTGHASLAVTSALDTVQTPFYCLAGAGLLYYVMYLITGRELFLAPILSYYLVLFFLLRWRVEQANRLDVMVREWGIAFVYEMPLRGPSFTIIIAALALPILLAIIAYAALFFRLREPALRYRIALVSVGLLAWVLTEALSFTTGWVTTNQGEVVRRLVALASALVVLAAYVPPRWARERWQVEGAA